MRNFALTISAAMVFAVAAPVSAQQRFDSADAAARAVIDSAEKHDGARLLAIFGPQGSAILTSGNGAQDRAEQSEFSRLAGTKHRLIVDPRNSNRLILSIGDEDWPFPVPIVRKNGKWSFDASEGQAEMQARSIGARELGCWGAVEHNAELRITFLGLNRFAVFSDVWQVWRGDCKTIVSAEDAILLPSFGLHSTLLWYPEPLATKRVTSTKTFPHDSDQYTVKQSPRQIRV